MNYRHTYHAGNFADVFKHIILVSLINALSRKENAFCYLDTHAGLGYYDLLSEQAQKSKEFESGIYKLCEQKNPPELIKRYLECVHAINPPPKTTLPRYYPGSPCIVNHFLRSQDRMILSELHPEDYETLKHVFINEPNIAIHHQDGYLSLKAFTPPPERRGLILIDPPYEKNDELMQMIPTLERALIRWETGIYALWYPIKNRDAAERFQNNLKERISRPMLVTELSIYPENTPLHLNGCGMVIINPPWQIDQEIAEILPWLWKTLSPHKQGRFSIIPLS